MGAETLCPQEIAGLTTCKVLCSAAGTRVYIRRYLLVMATGSGLVLFVPRATLGQANEDNAGTDAEQTLDMGFSILRSVLLSPSPVSRV
jgi:hypothetical protein